MIILEMVTDSIRDITELIVSVYTNLRIILKMKLVIFNRPGEDGIIYTYDRDICEYLDIHIGGIALIDFFRYKIPIIVLGECYDELDTTTRSYVIKHQRAHIDLHLPATDEFTIIDSIRELEADELVAKDIGNIGVLSSLLVLKGLTNEEDIISDLEYRIEYFKNKLNIK